MLDNHEQQLLDFEVELLTTCLFHTFYHPFTSLLYSYITNTFLKTTLMSVTSMQGIYCDTLGLMYYEQSSMHITLSLSLAWYSTEAITIPWQRHVVVLRCTLFFSLFLLCDCEIIVFWWMPFLVPEPCVLSAGSCEYWETLDSVVSPWVVHYGFMCRSHQWWENSDSTCSLAVACF